MISLTNRRINPSCPGRSAPRFEVVDTDYGLLIGARRTADDDHFYFLIDRDMQKRGELGAFPVRRKEARAFNPKKDPPADPFLELFALWIASTDLIDAGLVRTKRHHGKRLFFLNVVAIVGKYQLPAPHFIARRPGKGMRTIGMIEHHEPCDVL